MILDTIFIYTGYTLIISFMIWAILRLCGRIITRIQDAFFFIKAIVYHELSQRKEYAEIRPKVDLRLSRRWNMYYKGKKYVWEIVSIEKKDEDNEF